MKRDVIVILLCFLASAIGANIQPILTGAGKVEFPEASPRAYLQASSGALTVAAGGTNKNVILAPTGTGQNITTAFTGIGLNPSTRQLAVRSPEQVVASFSTTSALAGRLRLYGSADLETAGMELRIIPGVEDGVISIPGYLAFETGLAERARFGTNGLAILKGSAPTYAIDATGDVNATGVFRKAGTAGVGTGSTITVCTSGACASSCTLVFSGGIRTGGTCP